MTTVESARRLQYSNACGRYGRHQRSVSTKIWLYKAIFISVGIYASETWKITTKIAQKSNVFHQRCMHKILHVTYREVSYVTYQHVAIEVLLITGSRKLADTVAEWRFRMTGHILRLPNHRPSNVAMSWTPDDGRRRREVQRRHGAEHSRKTWREPTSHGNKLNTLRCIVLSGVRLLHNVPTGTLCSSLTPQNLSLLFLLG